MRLSEPSAHGISRVSGWGVVGLCLLASAGQVAFADSDGRFHLEGTLKAKESVYKAGASVDLTLDLNAPLPPMPAGMRLSLRFYPIHLQGAKASLIVNATEGLKKPVLDTDTDEFTLPLRISSDRRHVAIDGLPTNPWLPGGGYGFSGLTVFPKPAQGTGRYKNIGTIELGWLDQGGVPRNPGRAPAFTLTPVAPDNVAPLLTEMHFVGRSSGPSGIPQVRKGHPLELSYSFEDDRSGFKSVFFSIAPITRTKDGYTQTRDQFMKVGLDTASDLRCSVAGHPLKGTSVCDATSLANASPGLYAVTFAQADDARGWGLSQEFLWRAGAFTRSGPQIITTIDAQRLGGGTETPSAQYWSAAGHSLKIPLAVFEIVE